MEYTNSIHILPMVYINRIAVHGRGSVLASPGHLDGGIIAGTVARAIDGPGRACNTIGGVGCPVVAIGGCPGQ